MNTSITFKATTIPVHPYCSYSTAAVYKLDNKILYTKSLAFPYITFTVDVDGKITSLINNHHDGFKKFNYGHNGKYYNIEVYGLIVDDEGYIEEKGDMVNISNIDKYDNIKYKNIIIKKQNIWRAPNRFIKIIELPTQFYNNVIGIAVYSNIIEGDTLELEISSNAIRTNEMIGYLQIYNLNSDRVYDLWKSILRLGYSKKDNNIYYNIRVRDNLKDTLLINSIYHNHKKCMSSNSFSKTNHPTINVITKIRDKLLYNLKNNNRDIYEAKEGIKTIYKIEYKGDPTRDIRTQLSKLQAYYKNEIEDKGLDHYFLWYTLLYLFKENLWIPQLQDFGTKLFDREGKILYHNRIIKKTNLLDDICPTLRRYIDMF
jgi:hypothetical protein